MTSTPAELACDRLRGKKLLIFDFDGTLANTSHLHEAALNDTLAPFGIVVDYPAIAGLRTRDAIEACFAAEGQEFTENDIQRLAAGKQARVRTLISEKLQPFPGVDEFLRWARPRFRLAMYSSGSRGTVNIALEKLGYSGWLDPSICADDVLRAKPHPEGFLKVVSITGLAASDAVVFEDSDIGVAAATAAKCDVIRVMSGAASQSTRLEWSDLVASLRNGWREEVS